MQEKEPYFVIPTYRLRDVGETVEQYDEHFWRNGHSVRMIVFDDSSPANQAKYYPLLEQTHTHNDLYYVGPAEEGRFIAFLNGRLRDKRLESVVKNLFRPSYGGNRNCTLMYTLGGLMVSSDDDMRPFAFMEDSPESLGLDEVSRGKLYKMGQLGYTRKSFDHPGRVREHLPRARRAQHHGAGHARERHSLRGHLQRAGHRGADSAGAQGRALSFDRSRRGAAAPPVDLRSGGPHHSIPGHQDHRHDPGGPEARVSGGLAMIAHLRPAVMSLILFN